MLIKITLYSGKSKPIPWKFRNILSKQCENKHAFPAYFQAAFGNPCLSVFLVSS
jgi:hypothetical protein